MPLYKEDKKRLAEEIKTISSTRPYKLVLRHKRLPFKDIDKARRQASEGTVLRKIKNRIAKIVFQDTCEEFINAFKNENIVIMGEDIFDTFKTAFSLAQSRDDMEILSAVANKIVVTDDIAKSISKFKSEQGLRSALLNVISEVYKKPLRIMLEKANKGTE